MKKLVLIAILSLVPFTAFALDSMDDSSLDEITAQEGVRIVFDNVVVTPGASTTIWGDSDGAGTIHGSATTGGYIELVQDSGNSITLDDTDLKINVATASTDIAIGTGATPETIVGGTTFIAIELPAVTMGASALSTTISLGDNLNYTAGASYTVDPMGLTDAATLGTLYQQSSTNTTISGSVYIMAN